MERSSAKMEKFKFLGVELFHWWSLVAEGDKARISDDQILAQARLITDDAVDYANERRASGQPVPQLRFSGSDRDQGAVACQEIFVA